MKQQLLQLKNEIKQNIITMSKQLVKQAMEEQMRQEREEYLQQHPEDRSNGFYQRSIIDQMVGLIKGLQVPRTRSGQFRPSLLPPKWKRSDQWFTALLLAMFSSGLSRRRITEILALMLGVDIDPSTLTRRLESMSQDMLENFRKAPLPQKAFALWIDATRIRLRCNGVVTPCQLLAAVLLDWEGYKLVADFEVVVSEAESKDCYQELLERLRQRGLQHVKVVVSDGLPGLGEVINQVFPTAQHQVCVLHMLRQWLKKVRKQDQKTIHKQLKAMLVEATDKDEATKLLDQFTRQWGRTYPALIRSLHQRFEQLVVYLNYPPPVRRLIYTNNPVENIFKHIKRLVKQSMVVGSPVSAEALLVCLIDRINASLLLRRASAHLTTLAEETELNNSQNHLS